MSDDLAAFLAARLDEDERIAKRAARKRRAPWQISGRTRVISADGNPDIAVADMNGLDGELADHVALHGPDRALREVESGRRILERHRPDQYGCQYCERWARPGPCPDLRDLLARWDGHSDYRAEWGVDS